MNEINNQLLSNGVNIFSAETASNILLRESSRSNPGSLWHNLWMEGRWHACSAAATRAKASSPCR